MEIVRAAKEMGYASVRLHTLPAMRAAIALYRSMSFREIVPYDETPVEGVVFMELALGQG